VMNFPQYPANPTGAGSVGVLVSPSIVSIQVNNLTQAVGISLGGCP
jgi:hypothetical protein